MDCYLVEKLEISHLSNNLSLFVSIERGVVRRSSALDSCTSVLLPPPPFHVKRNFAAGIKWPVSMAGIEV